MQTQSLDKLRAGNANRWPNMAGAVSLSQTTLAALADIAGDLLPTDEGSLVVFGSLARGEYTPESDLDWTIIIDGRADSRHLQLVHTLKPRLKEAGFKVPGPTEMFGGLVFSHELIHAIGGDEDTNKNMTRRLLLLLESVSVHALGSKEVHQRIINGILHRYVEEDASFITGNPRPDKIPRFLLNDVIRFWRTMAVDYANKYRARAGEKWALRNIKLRMSRKLIFLSGLFMCISWALERKEASDATLVAQALVSHLREWTQRYPLESLAMMVDKYAPSLASEVFDAYDAFLGILNDEEKRHELEQLAPEEAYGNAVFLEARAVATRFDEAVLTLLFESEDNVTRLVKRYGVY